MKQHLNILITLSVILVPQFVIADTIVIPKTGTTTMVTDSYLQCKKYALIKKEKRMTKGYEVYRASSTEITSKTRENIDAIRWQIYSSYYLSMRKTIADQKQAMIPVHERITKTRQESLATWKVEDSLCDFMHEKELQEKHASKKKR